MTDPSNRHLLDAIEGLTEKLEKLEELEAMSQRMGSLEQRTIAIENARAAARSEYDENWAEVKGGLLDSRTRLERIEYQTTRTNGRVSLLEQAFDTLSKAVQELRDWKNHMAGAASVFSWWRSAIAGVVAGAVLYLLNQ